MKRGSIKKRLEVLRSSGNYDDEIELIINNCLSNAKKYVDDIDVINGIINHRYNLGLNVKKDEFKFYMENHDIYLNEFIFNMFEVNSYCKLYGVPFVFPDRKDIKSKVRKEHKILKKKRNKLQKFPTYQEYKNLLDEYTLAESEMMQLCKEII